MNKNGDERNGKSICCHGNASIPFQPIDPNTTINNRKKKDVDDVDGESEGSEAKAKDFMNLAQKEERFQNDDTLLNSSNDTKENADQSKLDLIQSLQAEVSVLQNTTELKISQLAKLGVVVSVSRTFFFLK